MPPAPFPTLPEYDIHRRIARGGMGEVFLARVLEGGLRDTDVILKRLYPRFAQDRAHVDLFVAEARLGERIVHPNIAQTYELLRRGEDFFIVQEYVDGCALSELMQANGVGAPLAARVAAFSDLLHALAHLQGGVIRSPEVRAIIHRDISPGNLVVRRDGVAKLVDLGIAEIEGKPDHQRSGALRGTAAYMSPEQARGRVLDRRSDLFSAGVMLWELLAGRPLYAQANDFETIRMICEEDAPPIGAITPRAAQFEPMLTRALARDRTDRFDSAAEMLAAFQAACGLAEVEPDREALAEAVLRKVAEHASTSHTSGPESAASTTPGVA